MKEPLATTGQDRHESGPKGSSSPGPGALPLALAVLRCVRCKTADFAIDQDALRCKACNQPYPIEGGIVDALPTPSQTVVDELRGMMREAKYEGDWRSFAIAKVDALSTMEQLKAISRDNIFDYFGSTELNLLQALDHVTITGNERVLEIGSQDDCPFLKPFRDRGCVCYATNIFFRYDDASAREQWPVRVLSDMHDLPYRDGAFDIILLSASTHHGELDKLVPELARVTRPGGVVININEPIRGLLKHAFSKDSVAQGHQDQSNRDGLVHEHEYSALEYLRTFRKAGFTVKAWLFSEYYNQRLSTARTTGVRFARLAGAVQSVWHYPLVRRIATGPGLWLGQAIIGLQMNAIFRKTSV